MKNLTKIASVFSRATAQASHDAFSKRAETKQATKPQPTHTISLRVTDDEKVRLERDAAGMSRSAYMRERLFGADAKPRKTRGKYPVKDYEALGRVLGLLGRTNLANDLSQLEWAIEQDIVKIDAPTALAIKMACVDIAAMRRELIIALGLKTERAS